MERNVHVQRNIFLTRGVGVHKDKLISFELALRDASICRFNLVKVSSIFPPHARLIPPEEGLSKLDSGQIVFCVLSENSTSEPYRLISASVGLAQPQDPDDYGYLAEHHSYGQSDEEAGRYAEYMAASMLSTLKLGEDNPAPVYDEEHSAWIINDKVVQSMNIAQSAMGHKDGLWTTVVAAAVFTP